MRVKHLWYWMHIYAILCSLGCDCHVEQYEEFSDLNVHNEVLYLINEFAKQQNGASMRNISEEIISKIRISSNKVEMVKAIDIWIDSLPKLEVSDWEFEKQYEAIRTVNDVFIYKNAVVQWVGQLMDSYEKTCEAQLKVLSWQRAQIDRLKPRRKINYETMTQEEQDRYLHWRKCYMSSVSYYEHTIRRMERVELPIAFQKVSAEEKEVMIKKIENFLQRKIRTPQEAEATMGEFTESEEMTAVRRREVGP